MKLHTERIASMGRFDRFDDAIRCARRDVESWCDLFHRLMMSAVHRDARRADRAREMRLRLNVDGMRAKVGRIAFEMRMPQCCGQVRVDVLV